MNLIKDILEYTKKYYPFIWKVEGPYLFISNKGFEKNKEQGIAYFPSIKHLSSSLKTEKRYKETLEDFKSQIDNQMSWYICEPEVRGLEIGIVSVKFTEEFEEILKPLREKYNNLK